MALRASFVIIASFISVLSVAQKPTKEPPLFDTSIIDYDILFSELDAFLDSITAPRTFFLFNTGIAPAKYSQVSGDYEIRTLEKILATPSVSFFHKSGLGLSAEAAIVDDGKQLNAYQYALTGSYDYLWNHNFLSGLSYTHYITKDDVAFYTSPLQNQLFAYFTYRKFWLKPSVALSYGWGSRTEYEDREEKIIAIQLAQRGFTRINTQETISDLNLLASVRRDFYWLNVFGKNDFVRLTPQISFTSGTHQFGFNQTSNSYATITRTGTRILYNSESVNFDNRLYFQPLSLTGFLKAEYSVKKIFVQPQMIFDYYFPVKQDNFSTTWLVNIGMVF